MKAAVVTVSDRAYQGVYEDLSGPAAAEILSRNLGIEEVPVLIVPDEKEKILEAFKQFSQMDMIVTSGGTGLGERDITPDVTAEYCDRDVPGIYFYLISESLKFTVNAALSRMFAGEKDKTLIINIPGSVKAAKQCSELICKFAEHSVKMMHGEGH